jgi:hypothetical protein
MGHGIDALYRMTVFIYLNSVQCQQQFWFRSKPTTPAPNIQTECDTIAADWRTYIRPKYQAFMTGECQMTGSITTCLNPDSLAQTVETYSLIFGSAAGDALPPHDAGILSLYSGYPGRRTHGRLYIPGVPEGQTAQGNLSTAWQTKLDDIGFTLLQHYGETGTFAYAWGGVYSRKNGAVRIPTPFPHYTYSPLAHLPWRRYVANLRVATQRHRKLGRGQ